MTRGFGSIPRFGDGWRPSIRILGQRLRKVFPTKALAEVWLKQQRLRKVALEAGAQDPAADLARSTYADVIPELREHYRLGIRRRYTPRTLQSYRVQLDALEAYWKTRRLAATTEADVDAYVAWMRRRGWATSTIRHQLDRLSAVHRLAVRRGWLARLPCMIERPPLVLRSKRPALPQEAVKPLLEAARSLEDPEPLAIIVAAYRVGLRLSEIARLDWADLRLKGARPSVHVRVTGETDRTKSARGRDVPLTRDAVAAFRRLGPKAAGPVFPNEKGGYRDWKKVAAKATVAWRMVPALATYGKGAQLHMLRHSYGTELIAREDPRTVQLRMGHASFSTTEGYLHDRERATHGPPPPAARKRRRA